jgi:hypothetical protein
VWEHKIKITKNALKEWIKNSNNTPSSHKRETIQQLTNLQMKMENKDITSQERRNKLTNSIPFTPSIKKKSIGGSNLTAYG